MFKRNYIYLINSMNISADTDFVIISGIILVIFAILINLFFKTSSKLPPGPIGLPFLGYFPFLKKESYLTLHELKQIYGNILSLYLGRQLAVVLGDFDIVTEVLNQEPYLGRPYNPPNNVLHKTKSFSGSTGNIWHEHRRFIMRSFKDLGYGKTKLENQIKEEIELLVKEIKKFRGRSCDIRKYLQSSISNIPSFLIMGRRFDFDDPLRVFMDTEIRKVANFFGPTSIHAFFNWIRPILAFFRIRGYDILQDSCAKVERFIEKEIEQHKKTLNKEKIRDYIDDYLIEMQERQKNGSTVLFTTTMLKGNCLTLLAAGFEPVLATVEWTVATLAIYQDVQRKVQKELDEIIGRNRLPEWADHNNLPYCNATIWEIQRWETILPMGMLRRTTKRTNIRGYDIPVDTIVISNIWGVHHDSKYWSEPEIFKPERFLTSDGKLLDKKPLSFIPFSYGRRSCPAETLGKIEVFLYVTNLLHCFDIHLPEEIDRNFDKNISTSKAIKEYKLCLIPRE